MRLMILSLVSLTIGCVGGTGTIAPPPPIQTIDITPNPPTTLKSPPGHDFDRDAGLDNSSSVDAGSLPASVDSGSDASPMLNEAGTGIACQSVATTHCITDMATICIEFAQSSEGSCQGLGAVLLTGACGSDSSSDLSRSSGGCLNNCGLKTYYYPLGSGIPTPQDRQAIQQLCASNGLSFVSTQ